MSEPVPVSAAARQLAIRAIAMPADTNANGDIFGGWLMSQMDMAAGAVAARVARGRVATVAVDAMSFHEPVKVGDEVTVYADVVKIGRTSIRMAIEAHRRPRGEDVSALVTRGVFTFVAIDDDGRPRPIVDPGAM